MDECALGYCINGQCTNLPGDYKCVCEVNYIGNTKHWFKICSMSEKKFSSAAEHKTLKLNKFKKYLLKKKICHQNIAEESSQVLMLAMLFWFKDNE